MAFGTAPRKVNGVWVTRKGRRLSDAGQKYWENLHAQGRTDAQGHMTRTGIGGGASATTTPKPKPAPKPRTQPAPRATVGVSSDVRGQRGLTTRVGYKVTPTTNPRLSRQAVAIRRAESLGQISPIEARDRLNKLGVYGGRHLSKAELFPIPKGVNAILPRAIGQVAQSAVYSPAGLYQTGQGLVKDTAAAGRGDFSFKHTRKIGVQMVKSTAEDFQHPLRNLGFLALDLSAAASAGAGTAARVGAAGRALAEREGAGAAARALIRSPEPGIRTIRSGGLKAHPLESRNKALAALQRAHDRRVNREAAAQPESRVGRSYVPRRVGRTLGEERRLVTEPAARAPAGALAQVGKKLSRGEQYALRMVAEQAKGTAQRAVTIAERRAFHHSAGDSRQVALTDAAARYLTDTPEGPKIRPQFKNLQGVYDRLVNVAGNRDELLKAVGRLEPGTAEGRVSGPARLIGGGTFEKPTPGKIGRPSQSLIAKRARVDRLQALYDRARSRAGGTTSPTVTRLGGALSVAKDELAAAEKAAAKRMQPTGIVGAEDLRGAGEARIPYAKEGAVRSLFRPTGTGRGRVIGGAQSPASLRHQFTGGLLRRGGGRQDVTRLVAESNIEAQKLSETLRVRDQLKQAAVPHPPERGAADYVAIRLDNPKSANLTPFVRDLIDAASRKAEDGQSLTRAEKQALRKASEQQRSLYIYGDQTHISKLTPAEQEEFSKLYEAGKIGWVNKRLLGGLDQPDRMIGPGVHRLTSTVDAINNVTRLGILYLKPAYAIPNLLGNAALNLVQQGFAAPGNLARAARLNARLSPEAAAKVDAAMGEGFVRAVSGEGGVGRKAVDAAANVWSKGVDIPFRRSAFLYEARRATRALGMEPTWENIEKLITDPQYQERFSDAVRRGNKEVIDYGNLRPAEREIVRRIVFFYPWVKGSTVYAGRFALEHPIKAAALAKIGQQGEQFSKQTLGDVPSRYEGAFKAGGGLVNPASAAILGTPAQVAQAAIGVAQGNVKPAQKLAQFLTPAASLAEAEINRTDPATGYAYPAGATGLDIAKDQLLGGLPQVALARNLRSGQKKGVLQPTRTQALLKFGIGSIAPTNYDAAALAKAARTENRALLNPSQRVLQDHADMRTEFLTQAKAAKLLPADATRLPKPLRDAITSRAKRYANYARAGIKPGSPDYQKRAFDQDVQTLLDQKRITPGQAKRALDWASTANSADLESERRHLGDKYFGGEALADARKKLKDAGHPVG